MSRRTEKQDSKMAKEEEEDYIVLNILREKLQEWNERLDLRLRSGVFKKKFTKLIQQEK